MTAASLYRLPPEQARAALALGAIALKHKSAQPPRRVLYPHQTPPDGEWNIWLLLGGRGAGKTEAGARYVDGHARGPACIEGPVPHRIAVVAPSHDDAVNTCVRGETGLLQVNRMIRFHPGAQLQSDLTWPNGSEAELFGTFAPEDVERFRGPQYCLVWGDEFAAWRKLDESWDMIQMGLRLGSHPHAVLTTTPKRRERLREVLAAPDTVITRARTADNPALPQQRRDALYARYGGTVLGRQELDAEVIEDIAGALWRREIITYRPVPMRFDKGQLVRDLVRIVVAIDPAVTFGEDSDETGIVVDGLGSDGFGYTLEDVSAREAPLITDPQRRPIGGWAFRAVDAYRRNQADCIVAEANNGGELVRTVIHTVDPNVPVRLVHASRGKRTRAEPVSALYEQGRWFHVGPFPELEDQQCSYIGVDGDSSPDRMDAHVWGATELFRLDDQGWGAGASWGSGAAGAVA